MGNLIGDLLGKGDKARQEGDDTTAEKYYLQALEIARQTDAILDIDHCHAALGILYLERAQYGRALDHFYQTLSYLEEGGGPLEDTSMVLFHIGLIYEKLKHFSDAITLFSDALELFSDLNNAEGLSLTLLNLGDCHLNLGKSKEAYTYLTQAIEHFQVRGEVHHLGMAYNRLGAACVTLQKWKDADFYLTKAQRLFEELDDSFNKGKCLSVQASLLLTKKRYQAAIACHKEALGLYQAVNAIPEVRFTLIQIGQIYDLWGKKELAQKYFIKTLEYKNR